MPVRRFLAGKSAGAKLGTAPGAKIGERAGELAHRSLITGALQFRRQAADQCPASRESKNNARASTFRKWRFASFPLMGAKRSFGATTMSAECHYRAHAVQQWRHHAAAFPRGRDAQRNTIDD
jgi:hypothetical protein